MTAPETAVPTADTQTPTGVLLSDPAAEKVKALLAQAGYTPERPLKVEIKSANTTETLLLMEAVQADWRLIGVHAQLVQNESQVAYQSYRARDFDVADAGWIASVAPAFAKQRFTIALASAAAVEKAPPGPTPEVLM